MSIAANQYANKVFAEHPISMWSLDEQAYYISLIDDNARKFTNWTGTGFSQTNYTSNPISIASPFPSSIVYSSFTKSSSTSGTIQIVSPNLFDATNIDTTNSTFCVNFFLYQNPTYITAFRVGYKYNNSVGTPQTVISSNISPPSSTSWINFNNVYNLPTSWSGSIKIFIEVDFISSSGGDTASRTITMHGLSMGQGSETTCYTSLGLTQVALPSELNMSSMKGFSADQYGVLADNGYFLIRNNSLLAHNDGLPIIYGTDNSTRIIPSGVIGTPSFVFPGKGLLHEKGRNKRYTLEMWIKIDPSTTSSQKIIGPLDTTDGIYVKEGFLTLAIDNEIGSHAVSEWHRPMLMHLSIKENNATIIINGEQVIDIPFRRNTVTLSNLRDWWGIYSYSTITMFDIDCISIFPYAISTSVAKRRFIYGQGTPSIQSIDNAYQGTPTTVEFATSEYGASIIYPDIARWDAGYFSNLDATKNYLSVPDYSLPIINIGGRDLEQWYADNLKINNLEYPNNDHPHFISFRPNIISNVWNPDGIQYQENCYLNFPSLNILNDQVSAIYGIFEIESVINTKRTLISFTNITNGETFDITINGSIIDYSINGRSLTTQTANIGTENLVGINIESLGNAYGYEVSRFFSSPASVQIYVGGNGIVGSTFEGKIYLVGFANQIDYANIINNFNTNGTAKPNNYPLLFDHITSYTLIPEYEFGKLFLDISISGQWEEYFPLTYFASYIKDENGNDVYDIDTLQINLGYTTVSSSSVWTYAKLKIDPAATSYNTLKASSYKTSYLSLKRKNTSGSTVDVSSSSMQSYLTFQTLSSGANTPLSSFTYTKNLADNGVVYADDENTISLPQKVYDTKFLFRDNMVIYPPKVNNFKDYAAVIHLQVTQRSILKSPLKIKNFEISAKNLNYNSLIYSNNQKNYIGTKWGKKAYIVTDSVFNINNYKDKNPILINKTSTPYLYNAKKSGIKVINESISDDNQEIENKIFIPINENKSDGYKVAAMQFMINPSFIEGTGNIKMLEVKHNGGIYLLSITKNNNQATIKSYVSADGFFADGGSPLEGSYENIYNGGIPTSSYSVSLSSSLIDSQIISARISTSDINFYQNGRYVKNPVIENDQWTCIGIIFTKEIDFSNYEYGGIKLFGGFTFNNISYYLSSGLGFKSNLTFRTWQSVLDNDGYSPNSGVWQYWDGKTWQSVYITGKSTSYVTTPAEIYQTYVGTNSSIIDDGGGIRMINSQSKIITSAHWQDLSFKPA
jgi:hypothetical protein